jgi:hypothetical protein
MTRKTICSVQLQLIFSILDLQLVESMDEELADAEG